MPPDKNPFLTVNNNVSIRGDVMEDVLPDEAIPS
jgi:hypothetical protein